MKEELIIANITKTQGIAILAHQAITHPATVVGSAQDVTTKFAATLLLFHASVEAVENTNPGTFLVQVSGSASGNEDWVTIYEFDATISTANTEALTATEPVGETVMGVASTTEFAAKDLLYIQDTDTLVDSEWGICEKIVTDTSIDLIDGLTNAKESSDVIWNDVDIFKCMLDLTAIGRIRCVFQHEGSVGANSHIKALMITGDSIS